MAKNKIKESSVEVVVEPVVPVVPKKKSGTGSRRLLRFINVFGVFDRNQIVHAMPFILFLTVIIIGYIANSYYAEKMVREINKTKTELKEKRAEFISSDAELVNNNRQSMVAKSLEPVEVKESTEPPKMIIIQDPAGKK